MPTIYLEDVVNAPAPSVWSRVKDIRSPEKLTNMIHTVDVLAENARACSTDHGKIVETIISVDDDRRRVAYTATASPFPITHHNAAFAVAEEGEGSRSRGPSTSSRRRPPRPFGRSWRPSST